MGVIAVGGTGLFGCLWVSLSVAWEHWDPIFLWLARAVASLIFIGSIVTAWKFWNVTTTCKWELVGGVVLIVLGLLPTVWFITKTIQLGFSRFSLLFFWLLGLPLLASGFNFIRSWREERKHLKAKSD
jgi:hypothetical protein